jgi:DNA-binding NarL/FixJ family response regulator
VENNRRGILNRIRNLCCTGQSIITLTPLLFKYVNQLIPHDVHAFALTSSTTIPYMYYHSGLNEQFVHLLRSNIELFLDPKTEQHICWLSNPKLPKSGNLLCPDDQYYLSNNYQMMVRASGLHHTLDLRFELFGTPCGGLSLYRGIGLGFTEQDAKLLEKVGQFIEHALQYQDTDYTKYALELEQAMFIVDQNNDILMMTDSAKSLLSLLEVHYDCWEYGKTLPKTCYQIINELKYGINIPKIMVNIPDGVLIIRAEWMNSPFKDKQWIAIYLNHQLPRSMLIWTKLESSGLSPQQCLVAYLLITGEEKKSIMEKNSISPSVLKDCIKAIYQTFNVHSLTELIDIAHRWTASA